MSFDTTSFLQTCPVLPGVYRMLDQAGELLYVGKAKNLKNRLGSYFRKTGLAPKTQAMVARIDRIELTVTHSDTEALLLEQTLIKQGRPPYNVLLRDDKSYPYVHLSADDYPRLSLHRGPRKAMGRYFGPYPGGAALRESLNLLQKAFQVRQCEDSHFRNRSRPCLQYQIGRCKAPCTGLVSPAEYAVDIRHSIMFLEGRSDALIRELTGAMDTAAAGLEFEKAARLRDQIAVLHQIQKPQNMETRAGNLDIAALVSRNGAICIGLIMVRDGRVLGSKAFFPKTGIEEEPANILLAFLEQYYLQDNRQEQPDELVVSHAHKGFAVLARAMRIQHGHGLRVSWQVRTIRQNWLQLAHRNAEQALETRLRSRQLLSRRLEQLQQTLHLEQYPERLECFDISHSGGEATVASCVVFGPEGPIKAEYRRYNITGISPGDDYAAMQLALSRRFARPATKGGNRVWPDLLLIDGGKGQLNMARQVLDRLHLSGIVLLGVAKGVTRRPGLETLYLNDAAHEFFLPADSPALHLIQQIRDEAHRFAITGHRAKRARTRNTSTLENIPGIGPQRRQALLGYFGGLQALREASADEIARTPGISKKLAVLIYATLHTG